MRHYASTGGVGNRSACICVQKPNPIGDLAARRAAVEKTVHDFEVDEPEAKAAVENAKADMKTDASVGYDSSSQMPVPVMPSGTVELKSMEKSPTFLDRLFN